MRADALSGHRTRGSWGARSSSIPRSLPPTPDSPGVQWDGRGWGTRTRAPCAAFGTMMWAGMPIDTTRTIWPWICASTGEGGSRTIFGWPRYPTRGTTPGRSAGTERGPSRGLPPLEPASPSCSGWSTGCGSGVEMVVEMVVDRWCSSSVHTVNRYHRQSYIVASSYTNITSIPHFVSKDVCPIREIKMRCPTQSDECITSTTPIIKQIA